MNYRPRLDKSKDIVCNDSNNHHSVLHKHVHPKTRRTANVWRGAFDNEDFTNLGPYAPNVREYPKVTDSKLSIASESVFYAGSYLSFDPIVVSQFEGSKLATRLDNRVSSYSGRRSVAHKIPISSELDDLRLVRKRKRTVKKNAEKMRSRNRRPQDQTEGMGETIDEFQTVSDDEYERRSDVSDSDIVDTNVELSEEILSATFVPPPFACYVLRPYEALVYALDKIDDGDAEEIHEASDITDIFNENDLCLLQHMRDSAGLILKDLFDSHLTELIVDEEDDALQNRREIRFANFRIRQVTSFDRSDDADSRYLKTDQLLNSSSDMVWVSHAVERCLDSVSALWTEGGFGSSQLRTRADSDIMREPFMQAPYKIGMLSASLKNAASDCRMYLERKNVMSSDAINEIGETLFKIDHSNSSTPPLTGCRTTYRECDPFLDQAYFTVLASDQKADVQLLLDLHTLFYEKMGSSREYLMGVCKMYETVEIPSTTPNVVPANRYTGTATNTMLTNVHIQESGEDGAVATSVVIPYFEDLVCFPSNSDAERAWRQIFSVSTRDSFADRLRKVTNLDANADTWGRQASKGLKAFYERESYARAKIILSANASHVSVVARELRRLACFWMHTIAKEEGTVGEVFFDSGRTMSHDTALALSFWLSHMRDGSRREATFERWRRSWSGGFFLPNCVRYIACKELFAETSWQTLGPLSTANLWCLIAMEMHLAMLTLFMRMTNHLERRLLSDIDSIHARRRCALDEGGANQEIRVQICRLVGLFAKRSDNIRDAKNFRSEAERHEFYKALDENIMEARTKLQTILARR
ncbi:hypothetical protein CYMTET_38599 [Cymbomonas tetramitiformis]|uniref:Uncharacterized protein n=1 Tax=Cymbomonas tetramitiformis TaxID=36881 RepID=A0AAE0CBJ8_9CHLO|nr:hypothetical protein CYMTET_38599 [Cymbomonas tetramitiformis]